MAPPGERRRAGSFGAAPLPPLLGLHRLLSQSTEQAEQSHEKESEREKEGELLGRNVSP